MQRSPRCLIAAITALVLLVPSTALAQEPGVTFDDGPSSKEYAIPLDAARGQTQTTPKPKAQTAVAPATTPTPAATTTTPAKKSERKKSKDREDKAAVVPPVTTTPDPPSSLAAPAVQSDPTSSDGNGVGARVVIGGLALAVIALGALAGLVLRRRRSSDAPTFSGS